MLPLLSVRPVHAAVLSLTLVLTSTGFASAGAPPVGQDKPLVTFGIGPATMQGPDTRPFLQYGVAPGSVVLDSVAVVNQSDVPLDLLVYASDGQNSEAGGLDIRKRADRNADLGAWVTVGAATQTGMLDPSSRSLTTVSVPPQNTQVGQGQVLVPVRIAVPADASPGDHIGGVAAALISRGDSAGSQNIELEQRVVTRVLMRVAGPLNPALSVEVLESEYLGGPGLGLAGSVRVKYRVTNTGNVRLGATSRLDVRGPAGLGGAKGSGPKVDELIPKGSAILTTIVPEVPPTVLASVKVVVDAVAPPGGDLPAAVTASDDARFWAVTWLMLAVLLLLLLLVAWLLWRRRRRQAPRGGHGRSSAPAPDDMARLGLVRPGA